MLLMDRAVNFLCVTSCCPSFSVVVKLFSLCSSVLSVVETDCHALTISKPLMSGYDLILASSNRFLLNLALCFFVLSSSRTDFYFSIDEK